MSDTANLRQRIADELNRQPGDIIGSPSLAAGYAINREINDAIRHYESVRFRWNEVRENEFATTVSGSRTISLPATFVKLDSLKVIYNGSYIRMRPRTWDEIETMDMQVSMASGPPTLYAIYGNVLRIFPQPNDAYTLVGSYIQRFLPTSLSTSFCQIITMGGGSITTTTTASHNNRMNGWTTDGEALIRARASAAFQINYAHNDDAIGESRQLAAQGLTYLSIRERIEYERLSQETYAALSTGRIQPSFI